MFLWGNGRSPRSSGEPASVCRPPRPRQSWFYCLLGMFFNIGWFSLTFSKVPAFLFDFHALFQCFLTFVEKSPATNITMPPIYNPKEREASALAHACLVAVYRVAEFCPQSVLSCASHPATHQPTKTCWASDAQLHLVFKTLRAPARARCNRHRLKGYWAFFLQAVLGCVLARYTLISHYARYTLISRRRVMRASRFVKGECSGNRVKWFLWCYILSLSYNTTPIHCTPL